MNKGQKRIVDECQVPPTLQTDYTQEEYSRRLASATTRLNLSYNELHRIRRRELPVDQLLVILNRGI